MQWSSINPQLPVRTEIVVPSIQRGDKLDAQLDRQTKSNNIIDKRKIWIAPQNLIEICLGDKNDKNVKRRVRSAFEQQ